jgi:hypothetical protein
VTRFILVGGAGLAMWQAGALARIPGIPLAAAVAIAAGLGVLVVVRAGPTDVMSHQ